MVDSQGNRRGQPTTESTCPRCGAPVSAELKVCWICFSPLGGKLPQGALQQPVAAKGYKESSAASGGFSLASLMMLVTLVAVVLGMFTISPGFGMPLAIVAAITWVRTVSVVKYRSATGKPATKVEIVLMFVRSVAVTLVILMLVGVAAAAALAAACTGMIGASGGGGEVGTIFGIAIVVLIAAVLGIVVAARYERGRWQRDHRHPS